MAFEQTQVAEIWVEATESRGTGYLLCPGCLLTAHHVVKNCSGTQISFRLLGDFQIDPDLWLQSSHIWTTDGFDIALIFFERETQNDADWEISIPPIAQLASEQAIFCKSRGFPAFAEKDAQYRDYALQGQLKLLDSVKEPALAELDIQGQVPQTGMEAWKGFSGSPVFTENGLLVGIVTQGFAEFQGKALEVLSIGWLLSNPTGQEFRQQLESHSPSPITIQQVKSSSLQTPAPPPDPNQEATSAIAAIVDRLSFLNYEAQNQAFKQQIPASRRAAAFVVQAKDSRIQHWLVKRLVNQIPNVANAKVFTFLVPTHPMWKNRNFAEIWTDLSEKLKCAAEPSAVIEALVQGYQTQPVILALYGWTSSPRSQTLQKQVLSQLWEPLVRSVDALVAKPRRSRLILFLAEASEVLIEATAADKSIDVSMPMHLAPLKVISQAEVENWFDSDRVDELLQQWEISESRVDEFLQEEIPVFEGDPIETIDQICYIFNLDNGIADIEAEWKLAG